MSSLKYTVIKSEGQYKEYCRIVQEIGMSKAEVIGDLRDEVELLCVLIAEWEGEPEVSVYELPYVHPDRKN